MSAFVPDRDGDQLTGLPSQSEVERSYREALAAMRERAERAERERDEAIEALADLGRCIDLVAYEGRASDIEELDEARRIAAVLLRLRSNEKGADRG